MLVRARAAALCKPAARLRLSQHRCLSSTDHPEADTFRGPGGLTARQIFARVQQGKEEGDVYWRAERIITTTTADPQVARELADAAALGLTDSTEESAIKSLYWWEGRVDPSWEILLSFRTKADFSEVCAALESVHDYAVPMIASVDADGVNEGQSSPYWRATIGELGEDDATKLVEQRICACVQLFFDGKAFIKTTDEGRRAFGEANSASWAPLQANPAYLAWLQAEVQPPQQPQPS